MARADHRFVVTMKDRWTGEQFTVHLVQAEVKGRFWPKFNGKNSKRYPEITSTELGRKISGWLKKQQEKGFCWWDLTKYHTSI